MNRHVHAAVADLPQAIRERISHAFDTLFAEKPKHFTADELAEASALLAQPPIAQRSPQQQLDLSLSPWGDKVKRDRAIERDDTG